MGMTRSSHFWSVALDGNLFGNYTNELNERARRVMATPEDARRANRSLLLGTLHRDGPLSRADLAKQTGLTRATVSAVVRDLIDESVVEELGVRAAGGVGKPATLVGINADGRHVVCLDVSEPEEFVGAVVNLDGKVVVRRTYDRKGRSGRAAVTLLRRICRELVGDAGERLVGVGIATPGVVRPDGVITTAAHLGWADLPLAAELSAQLGLPVHVVNDANAAALAEVTFGEPGAPDLICVRVDEGVGAGLVLGGRLFTGSSHAAGEIGHVVVSADGTRCACGQRGCLETEVSEPLLDRRLGEDGADETAVLRAAGTHLGTALATVVGALDVTEVVLSGPPTVATETFRAAAADAIASRTLPVIGDRLIVRPSTLGFDDVLVGAAARVLDQELGLR
jgi:predicted NBD/HSP70 family sugar kinase